MRNKISLLFLLLFFTNFLIGQKMGFKSTTRAVVVGISDYQDEAIPDLKYAHKDAGAFVEYLQSPAGGNLPDHQIISLINEKATIAQIYSALDWLIEESKKGDQVIIYLSGHGDVETKTIRQRGYYLAYDSPANNYRIGAVRLEDLNDVIATVSQSNESKVIMISDACRSGKLAGNGVDGTQVTASAFSTQYAKELRILSCQPNEFSLEGKQWGGGRGVFSYNLIDGLIGLADNNDDEMVNLREVERYLEDQVAIQVQPQQQNPMVVGNKLELVSFVDQLQLNALKEKKAQDNLEFGMVGTRALADGSLSKADSTITELYTQFNLALEEKYFLPRDTNEQRIAGESASELYAILINEPSIADLHNLMKRNFAAALQDVAQQSLNAYLRADQKEMNERWVNYGKSYAANPDYLTKAAELLGPEHYIYEQLLVKKYYFEGLIKRLEAAQTRNRSLLDIAFSKVDTALSYDDQAAYVFNELGVIAAAKKELEDAEENYTAAMALAPTWVIPVNNMVTIYKLRKKYNEAIEMGERAIELDSTYSSVYYNMGVIYFFHKKDEIKAKEFFTKTLELNDSHFKAHANLGTIYLNKDSLVKANYHFKKSIEIDENYYLGHYFVGLAYTNLNQLDSAGVYIDKAYSLDSTDVDIVNLKGYFYLKKDNFDLSEQWLLQAKSMDSTYVYPRLDLADLYLTQNDLVKANNELSSLQNDHSTNEALYFHLARLHILEGDTEQALSNLAEAFQKGFKDKKTLDQEPDFDSIRNTQPYKDLIEQYFTEQ